MKKLVALLLGIALLGAALAGCHARKTESIPAMPGQESGSREIVCIATGYQTCQPNTRLPVTLSNGNLILTAVDLAFPGRGMGVVFHRTYNSLRQKDAELSSEMASNIVGSGWTAFLDQKVIKHSDGNLIFCRSDGGVDQYNAGTGGKYINPQGVYAFFEATAAGYIRVDKNGVKTVFDPQGRMVAVKDRNNNQITIHWKNQTPEQVTDTVGRVFQLAYNSQNKLKSVQDPAGRRWQYFYDKNNLLTKVQDPMGLTRRYAYDENQRLIKYSDAQKGEYSFAYDSQGKICRVLDPLKQATSIIYGDSLAIVSTGQGKKVYYHFDTRSRIKAITRSADKEIPETYVWDDTGNLTALHESYDRETKFTYDAQGNVLSQTNALGQTFRYRYEDKSNRLLEKVDPQNNKTQYQYDQQGNLIVIKDPLGYETRIEYSQHGLPVTKTDPNGNSTRYEYNQFGELAARVFADQSGEKYTYNRIGKIAVRADALGQSTRYEYDPLGRLTKKTDPAGQTVEYQYDANGNIIMVKDPKGNASRFAYNPFGYVVHFTNPLGQITTYDYDTSDILLDGAVNLIAITDSKNNKTGYVYDLDNRLIKVTFPDMTSERLEYDTYGNVKSQTNRSGKKLSMRYDALNRIIEKEYADQSKITFTYNINNQIAEMTDQIGRVHYTYNALGRAESVVDARQKKVSYRYDANGNITRLGYPDDYYITYTYDSMDRLTGIFDPKSKPLARFEWDALSRRKVLYLGENIKTTYAYNNSGQIENINNYFKGKEIFFSRYAYDLTGNLTRKYTNEGISQYIYDKSYQIIQAGMPDRTAVLFEYDDLGNRISVKKGFDKYNYQTNQLNQYLQVNETRFNYDSNGNLIQRSGPDKAWQYNYDQDNRLVEAAAGENIYIYAYDGYGRRLSKAANNRILEQYVYDQYNVIADLDQQNRITAKYIYAPGLDDPLIKLTGDKHYYIKDAQKTITAILDDSAVLEKYTYDTSGRPAQISQLANRYLFTGREYDDETGLYYFRARHYDPRLGRFVQPDPIGYHGGRNLYQFMHNNAANFLDPFGLDTILLNESGAVSYFGSPPAGHSALLIGDDVRGWHYFSKDGKRIDLIAQEYYLGDYGLSDHLNARLHVNVHKEYKTLNDFYEFNPRYDRSHTILTDQATEQMMIERASESVYKPYIIYSRIFGDNCWGFIEDVLNYADIPTGDPTIIPNLAFERVIEATEEYNRRQQEKSQEEQKTAEGTDQPQTKVTPTPEPVSEDLNLKYEPLPGAGELSSRQGIIRGIKYDPMYNADYVYDISLSDIKVLGCYEDSKATKLISDSFTTNEAGNIVWGQANYIALSATAKVNINIFNRPPDPNKPPMRIIDDKYESITPACFGFIVRKGAELPRNGSMAQFQQTANMTGGVTNDKDSLSLVFTSLKPIRISLETKSDEAYIVGGGIVGGETKQASAQVPGESLLMFPTFAVEKAVQNSLFLKAEADSIVGKVLAEGIIKYK